MHPVLVAPHRVDLAVVTGESEGLSARPAWKGVRAETRVNQRHRAFHVGMVEILKVMSELPGSQHAFVTDHPARQRRKIEIPVCPTLLVADPVGRDPADEVEGAFEGSLVLRVRRSPNQNLLHDRLRCGRGLAELAVVHGEIAPPEKGLSHLANDVLEHLTLGGRFLLIRSEIDHAHGEMARLRKIDTLFRSDRGKELVWHRHEHSGPVPSILIAAAAPAVIEIDTDLERVLNDLVRWHPFYVHEKPHSTGVVLLRGVVEALLLGKRWKRRFVVNHKITKC